MIFDTHAHYDDEAFQADRHALLSEMRQQGVGMVVNMGSSVEANERTLELAQQYEFIKGAFGIHPECIENVSEENLKRIEELCKLECCVAVGEIGLDYYWDTDKEKQRVWFERQMDLARQISKPIVVHSREAAQDTYDMMKIAGAEDVGGVVHCFSYGKEMAKLFLDMGFYIGVGGVLTFKNGRKLKEVVEYTPMDRIVLETDCPYLAPVPFRGKRNSSLLLPHVVDAISEIKGISREEIEQITWDNACRLYRL